MKTADRIALACVACLGATFIITVRPEISDYHGDETVYIQLARSLVAGNGFRETWTTGEPAAVLSTPLISVLLAPVALAAPTTIYWYKLPVAGIACIALFLLYAFARRRLPPHAALAVVVAFAANTTAYNYGTACVSELPYVALVLATLFVFDTPRALSRARVAAAISLCIAAFFTRKAGSSLSLGVVTALALLAFARPPRKVPLRAALIALVATATPIALWARHETANVSYGEAFPYRKGFTLVNPYDPREGERGLGAHVDRALTNARFYVPTAGAMAFPFSADDDRLKWPLGVLLIAAALFGFWRERRANLLFAVYPIFYTGVILLWAWYGQRLLLELMPILLVAAAIGVSEIGRGLRLPRATALVVTLPIFGQGAFMLVQKVGEAVALHEHRETRVTRVIDDYLTTMNRVKTDVPPDAVLVSPIPPQTYFLTMRRGYGIPYHVRTLAEAWGFFVDRRVTHLLLDETIHEADHIFRPLLARYGDRFREIFRLGQFRLFAVDTKPDS